MELFSLKNKHILITGATGGIGQQCAITCSNLGARLTLIGRDKTKLELLKPKLTTVCQFINIDITDYDRLKESIDETIKHNGKFDGLVHAAGIEITLPFKLHTKQVFQHQMEVNLFAGLEVARQLSLKKNHNLNCSLVFISSIMGTIGAAGQVGYGASKGALNAAIKSLAIELAPKTIRANTISPAQVEDTNMTSKMLTEFSEKSLEDNKSAHLLGWLSPIDVANSAAFLLGNASKAITGTNLIIDSGYTIK